MAELDILKDRFTPIFTSAADTAGCTVGLDWFALYEDVVTNSTLAEQYRQYMIQHLDFEPSKKIPVQEAKVKHDQPGSSDFGSCSYITPGIQAMFEIKAAGMPHSIPFREAAETEFAHTEALRAGKANALLGLDVLLDDGFAAQMKAEFEDSMEKAGRKSN